MKKRYHYLVCFWGNRSTTTGEPNKRTGRMSIACNIVAYTDEQKCIEAYNRCGNALICSKTSLRQYCLGMSVKDFEQYIDSIEWDAQ